MGLSTTFTLKFNGDAVKKGLAGVRQGLQSLGKAAVNIAKMGAAVAAFGVGAAAGIAALALKINAIGEAGRAGDKALANVTNQMGLFGDEADDVTKRLIDYADTVSRMNGVDGEAIGITQTKLMTFKELAKSANQAGGAFDRATMAAIDMASAGFGSAEQNAVQLGKALNDPVKGINSLTRSGITFTEQEKAKIKTLVESNQIFKAQDTILKAIETQVGGTAEASATASGKIKASFELIRDAFAEPFSEGFNSIPNVIENVFPKIEKKAAEMGKLFGTAISEAVNGDTERFFMIGSLIGDLIKEGAYFAMKGIFDNIGQSFLKGEGAFGYTPAGFIAGKTGLAEQHKAGTEYATRSEMSQALAALKLKYDAAVTMAPRGEVPNAPGYRYAQPNEAATMMDGERVVRILDSIDRKLSPQP
jgi:hypothetical protein